MPKSYNLLCILCLSFNKMTAATITPQPIRVTDELEIWEVKTNLPDAIKSVVQEPVIEIESKRTDSVKNFQKYMESKKKLGNPNRTNSLVSPPDSSLARSLDLTRSKSDGSIKIYYRDNIDAENNLDDNVSLDSNSSEDHGLKMFYSLKREIEGQLKRYEQPNVNSLFPKLVNLLKYSGWKVTTESTTYITELLPQLGPDAEDLFVKLMPMLLENLAHQKEQVVKASTELLKTFAETTNRKNSFVENFISFGLLHENNEVKMGSTKSIPRIFSEHFAHVDLFHFVQLLVNNLKVETDNSNREHILSALKHIRYIEGPKEFKRYQLMLSPKSGKILLGVIPEQDNRREIEDDRSLDSKFLNDKMQRQKMMIKINYENGAKLLKVIPNEILDRISREDSPQIRRIGCEELLSFLEWTPDIQEILPNLGTLLSLLNTFKDDPHFGVATISLRLISILIDRISAEEFTLHLSPIVHSTVYIFTDDRFVVRSEANQTFDEIWQNASPKRVAVNLSDILRHRSSRMRECAINIITSALLTFPRSSFDFTFLCREIVPKLADPKRRVRQAATECIATLAQVLGNQNLMILMIEVMDLEETESGMGVLNAVKSRLSRRTLPHLTSDGLIEYWLPVLSVSKRNFSGVPLGCDIEWILSASGPLSLGSVCEPASTSISSSFQSLDFNSHDFGSRDLSSSFPQPFLQSALRSLI